MGQILEDFSLKVFKDTLTHHKISMAFHGMFSQDVLSLIGISMKNMPNSRILSKRLFGLVVEMAQNIHHYSDMKLYSEKDKRDIGVGIVVISQTATHHVITSGNYIARVDAQSIRKRAAYINSLSDEQLKDYYKEQRKLPQRKDKPGANLGLIDMRRRSGNKIKVIIKRFDDRLFFILSIKINKE